MRRVRSVCVYVTPRTLQGRNLQVGSEDVPISRKCGLPDEVERREGLEGPMRSDNGGPGEGARGGNKKKWPGDESGILRIGSRRVPGDQNQKAGADAKEWHQPTVMAATATPCHLPPLLGGRNYHHAMAIPEHRPRCDEENARPSKGCPTE